MSNEKISGSEQETPVMDELDHPINVFSREVEEQLLSQTEIKEINITTNNDPSFYDGDKQPVLSGEIIGANGLEYRVRIIKYPEPRPWGGRYVYYKNFGTVNDQPVTPAIAIRLWDKYSPPIAKYGTESM